MLTCIFCQNDKAHVIKVVVNGVDVGYRVKCLHCYSLGQIHDDYKVAESQWMDILYALDIKEYG